MSNVPCKSLPCLCPCSSQRPRCATMKCVCTCVYPCLRGTAWQRHIWLPSGPWNCCSEVLRCLFIVRSLGARPYSLWHFQPLICRRIVTEHLSYVTLCSCHTVFYMATEVMWPCGASLALIQSCVISLQLCIEILYDTEKNLIRFYFCLISLSCLKISRIVQISIYTQV